MNVKETLRHTVKVLDEAADYYWALFKINGHDIAIDFKHFVKDHTLGVSAIEQLNRVSHEFWSEWKKGMLEWEHMNNVDVEFERHQIELFKQKKELIEYFKAHEDEL